LGQDVFGLGGGTFLLVFVGVSFGFFLGFFDILFAQVTTVLNGNTLLFAGAFVFGGDVQDTVGV